MKKLTLALVLFASYFSHSQTIEIEPAQYPYNDIIEWKGMGALLLSSDPTGNAKQINLTLVGNQNSSIWDQKFTPKNEKFYYISSENARYVYFIDNLELTSGKSYFSQLNSAGNVKSTSVNIGTAIKKLGSYDYNKLEMVNIVVTDKALVYHLRYDDKKMKSSVEFAVFMTHHNFLPYAVELGKIPYEHMKDEKYGRWEYVGFTGDKIFFAVRDFKNKTRGWSTRSFTSKGKDLISHFIEAPEGLIPVENIGFGTTGKYYLEDKNTIELGLLTNINDKFYLVGGQRKQATGAEVTLFELSGGEWKQLNEMRLSYFIEKKNLKLGIYPMNEGIGYHLDHNGYNKTSIIFFTPKKETAHNDFTERTVYNPSSVFEQKEREEFTVILPEALIMFNTNQLNKAGAVKFELKKK